MNFPFFSVVIPAYGNAVYLGEAIQSVLRQSYSHFELIVVNDASPDDVGSVVGQFNDPRIKFIVHQENRGLSAARNTGIRNSTGGYIALLDGDDYYHPDKFKAHLEFYNKHPDVDVTYNARLNLNHSSRTIRELWRPPLRVDLSDLVLGYPFSPSDMVIRRNRLFETGLFDESLTYFGEDMDINCRLALLGCKFASVDRALNFRRFHSGRRIRNLKSYHDDELGVLHRVFNDGRFPASLLPMKGKAIFNRLLGWAIIAFLQDDTNLGREYFMEAVRLTPSLQVGIYNELLLEIIAACTLDVNQDHGSLIRKVMNQLPAGFESVTSRVDWAIDRGWLIRGCRAVLWGRIDEAQSCFSMIRDISGSGSLDDMFLRQLSLQIFSVELEVGADSADRIISDLSSLFEKIGRQADIRRLKGQYAANHAFRSYNAGDYAKVPGAIVKTILNAPAYILNRGMIKIFFKSLVNIHN